MSVTYLVIFNLIEIILFDRDPSGKDEKLGKSSILQWAGETDRMILSF